MTYSRPANNGVRVSSSRSSANTPQVEITNRGSDLSPNSTTTRADRWSPQQAYQNGIQKSKEIGKFLDFFSDTVQPQIVQELDRRANRETGEFLQQFPAQDITSKGNEEYIDAFSSLSPRAQDGVINAQGAALSGAPYQQALETAYVNNPDVVALGNDDEARARRARGTATAIAEAREASGLSGLPAYQTAVNAEKLISAEGRAKTAAYKARIYQEGVNRRATLRTSAGLLLKDVALEINTYAASVEGDEAIIPRSLGATMQEIVDSAGETESVTGQTDVALGAIARAAEEMTPPEAQRFLEELESALSTPLVGVDKKTNLWDNPINERGDTLRSRIDEMVGKAEIESDKWNFNEVQVEIFRLYDLDTPESIQQADNLRAQYMDKFNNPEYAMRLFRNWEAMSRQPTDAQIDRQLDIEAKIINGTMTWKDVIAEGVAAPKGTYHPSFLLNASRNAMQDPNASPDKAAFNGWAEQQFNTDNKYEEKLFEDEILAGITGAYDKDEDDKPYVTNLGRKKLVEAKNVSRNIFVKKWREAAAAGTLDKFDARTEYINSLNAAKEQILGDVSKSDSDLPRTPKAAFDAWNGPALNGMIDASRKANRAVLPESSIAPKVIAAERAKNPNWSFDSLSDLQKKRLLAASFAMFKVYDLTTNTWRKPTQVEAQRKADEFVDTARRAIKEKANASVGPQARIPERVAVTEQEEAEASKRFQSPAYKNTVGILEKAAQYVQTKEPNSITTGIEMLKKVFNNKGMGEQAMQYADAFLNMVVGAAPATAQPLAYGDVDGISTLQTSWKEGSRGLKTGPMAQVSASTRVRPVPNAIANDQHELFVMIGVSEGTRTPGGGYTKAYYGHKDSGDGNSNRGTVSGGRVSGASPEMVDQRWMARLTGIQQRMRGNLIVLGLEPGTQGYNRVMFNILDLTVQSPQAAEGFVSRLVQMRDNNWTIESIAKARSDSFINPQTGRLEAGGFGNSYQRLFTDQRQRAGVYDYRRRL